MAEILHEKIHDDILKKIRTHYYEEGVMLPTEAEIASIYGTSKAPVRQAFSKLEQEGFIVRRAGKGTFVAGRSNWPYVKMSGNEHELISKGKFLYCITSSISLGKLTKDVAKIMNLEVGTKVLNIKRIRYFKDEPVNYLHHYVYDIDKKLIEKEGNFSSLLALYDKLGITVSKAEDVIEAVPAPREVAKWLKIEPGHPVLLINRCTYREDRKILEYVKFYINTKNWKYRAVYTNPNV